MKQKLENALSKTLGAIWVTTFTIASVTALIAIIKLFLKVVGVI